MMHYRPANMLLWWLYCLSAGIFLIRCNSNHLFNKCILKERKLSWYIRKKCKSYGSYSFLFLASLSLSLVHTHTHFGRYTKTYYTCRFLSAAAWLAGMAYMKCSLNCRFLVGVIIQAYMHGKGGLDFSPESSLPAFLPATSAGYCCELGILMDSPICFQKTFTKTM